MIGTTRTSHADVSLPLLPMHSVEVNSHFNRPMCSSRLEFAAADIRLLFGKSKLFTPSDKSDDRPHRSCSVTINGSGPSVKRFGCHRLIAAHSPSGLCECTTGTGSKVHVDVSAIG